MTTIETKDPGTTDLAQPADEDFAAMREIISAAFQAAGLRGVEKRNFRTGLWHLAISLALQHTDVPVLVQILEDRIASIEGYGSNADSQALPSSREEMRERMAQAVAFAEIMDDHLAPFLDNMDEQGKDGLTVAFNTILAILKEWWGPHHLRRILGQQVRALRAGTHAPILPTEPLVLNRKRPTTRDKDEPVTPPSPGRDILIHVAVTAEDAEISAFAYTLDIRTAGGDLIEFRQVSGRTRTGISTQEIACRACVHAISTIGPGAPEDRVVIISPTSEPVMGTTPDIFSRTLEIMAARNAVWYDADSHPEHEDSLLESERVLAAFVDDCLDTME